MKKNDVHEKIISVFSIAGLMTAFISLITTQQGLKQYTFSKDWQAFFISFSIQSALFVCNMKGPEILKALAGRKKFVLIFFYTIVLIEYSNAIVHAFQGFRAPFSGKIVHIFPEQSAAFN